MKLYLNSYWKADVRIEWVTEDTKEIKYVKQTDGRRETTLTFQKFLSFFFSFLCRQGSLLGDQTPFFLYLFSSRPPGNYAFLLRPLEGENLLKHALRTPLMNFFSTFFSGASSRGLLKTFSEGETCPQQLSYSCILLLWANAACLFSRERK
ncbi:unnamed protein product [Acanthosepion pharaonis]|uniref:Uncharacterized protein n=1 Tax=Acanthosepion pharaonis TaxID=158019 RepID=A0A812BBH8_ACAPH|nr:unnamed protein product [Sepia pharaonis]